MNSRLERIRKGKPPKETDQTDAVFADVRAVREGARDDPETLEISMDSKAKVASGEYVRGGKPGRAPTVRWPRVGITTRPPRRS
jgi:hypothetical protein